ncbi:hypothetical protein D9758_005413 [Tetrapyrgos nigripes]|uniref:SET domain-containing protein n=1 Tax=Tetrapyrgos nigripes TaxID=182062 RepID=A0A8H5LPN3_9AGAR|nr:hypothetical protein D9758_005413 [Tetrapyrgos nigripes]
MLDRLPKERQKAYRELWDCHTNDGTGTLNGVVRTNGFTINDYAELQKLGEDYPERRRYYKGVSDKLSCMNHSCRPNASLDYDSPTFSLHIRASRDTKKDKEITVCYISGLLEPASTLHEQTRRYYRFTCSCETCSNAAPSQQIKEMAKFIKLKSVGTTPARNVDTEDEKALHCMVDL